MVAVVVVVEALSGGLEWWSCSGCFVVIDLVVVVL